MLWDLLSETAAHCDNCRVAALYQLAAPPDLGETATRRQFFSSHAIIPVGVHLFTHRKTYY